MGPIAAAMKDALEKERRSSNYILKIFLSKANSGQIVFKRIRSLAFHLVASTNLLRAKQFNCLTVNNFQLDWVLKFFSETTFRV